MKLVLFLVVSGLLLAVAYRVLGRLLARWLSLDARAEVPARTMRDGLDFEPLKASSLLPQHFSAIAAAGPIVGPILAGTLFGWFPTWLWILLGSILIGGVHDITTLVASLRHQAKSVAELVHAYMNPRAYRLFLVFIWISLLYVVIAFADVTAGAFVQAGTIGVRGGEQAASAAHAAAPGPAVATSSMLYLLLAVAMGLTLRYTRITSGVAKALYLPLVFLAILLGPALPFSLGDAPLGLAPQQTWNYLLLAYCFFASIAPVWMLLQPRGELGGYFLYFITLAGVAGIVVGGYSGELDLVSPAVTSAALFTASGNLPPMFPILFITVACGACSGFHSIVTSGTTSKQLANEADAKPVAYGSMLLEAFFACLSLATVMILVEPKGKPDEIYAGGIARFMHHATFGAVPVSMAYQFALLCFATFVFDTLDACTRLARYVLMELTGWKGMRGMAMATAVTLAIPVIIATLPPAEVDGKVVPLWRVFWGLFGSSNQMLAALALLAVTVWLWRTGRSVTLSLFGTVFMLVMTVWSLGLTASQYWTKVQSGPVAVLKHVEFGVSAVLILLAVWLAGEAVQTWRLVRREIAARRNAMA